ncbi:MCP four helix bundle domain-containing protein, partial [Piscinibacter sakaiensis]
MRLSDLSIANRLRLGYAAMTLLLALVGTLALLQLNAVQREFRHVVEDRYVKIQTVADIRTVNAEVGQALRNLLIVTEPAQVQEQYAILDASSPRTNANMDKLKASVHTPEGLAALKSLQNARADYRAPREKLIKLLRAGQRDEARTVLLDEVRPRQVAYMNAVDQLMKVQEKLMDGAVAEAEQSVDAARRQLVALVGLGLVLALVLAWRMVRTTTGPLAEAVEVARAVAGGDLSRDFRAEGRHEIAQLLHALQDMKTQLARIVGDVRRNAEGVSTASGEIAQGNSDLSARTEQQASALEQTAASMEELSTTVQRNADNARQGNQLAMNASSVASQGGEVVSRVVDTMKGISESSRRISDIIAVIDGIAFQTNILALNAAVE